MFNITWTLGLQVINSPLIDGFSIIIKIIQNEDEVESPIGPLYVNATVRMLYVVLTIVTGQSPVENVFSLVSGFSVQGRKRSARYICIHLC